MPQPTTETAEKRWGSTLTDCVTLCLSEKTEAKISGTITKALRADCNLQLSLKSDLISMCKWRYTGLRSKCEQCFTDAKKKGTEKQEINLLQLAAFAGRFESMHRLLLLAQPAFKGRLINKQIHRKALSHCLYTACSS